MIHNCKMCGKEFYIKPSRIKIGKGKYCSRKCMNKYLRPDIDEVKKLYLEEKLSQQEVANRLFVSRPTIVRIIDENGFKRRKILSEEHKRKISPIGRIHGEETKQKMRLAQLGEKGHNWKGGSSDVRFRSPWKQNRIRALKRDGYKCQVCGRGVNTGMLIDVHHKIPFRCFRNPVDAHELDNLITLCRRCHFIEDADRRIKNSKFGKNCSAWFHCNIYNSEFGDNVKIGSFTEISGGVFGNNISVGAHSFIPYGLIIEDNAWIGPRFCGTNDTYPPSGRDQWKKTIIKNGARIGAAVTVLPGVVIGSGALIGAGSVVSKSVPAGEKWCGVPAKKMNVKE